jgi:hypothetical protein
MAVIICNYRSWPSLPGQHSIINHQELLGLFSRKKKMEKAVPKPLPLNQVRVSTPEKISLAWR